MVFIVILIIIMVILGLASLWNDNLNQNSDGRSYTAKKPVKKEFSVGERGVNQVNLGSYLQNRIGTIINLRYQSIHSGSARYWRSVRLKSFDAKYIYIAGNKNQNQTIKFRRDRVVGFR